MIARRILLSRILTRSGDQAWDFAVPLTLVSLAPGGLRATALYFLAVRLSQVVLAPRVGSLVDRWQRLRSAKVGIGAQVLAMLAGLGAILALSQVADGESQGSAAIGLLFLLVAAGIVSNLGALIMDIAVANDIVPTAIPPADLPAVNSRLKQIDLATEVGAPIAAGALLAMSPPGLPLLGFTLVALWNVLSFFPEYRLIRSVINSHPELRDKAIDIRSQAQVSLLTKITAGWKDFFRQPVMPAVAAYALLWLSVLSPHGVLLAAFLKDEWDLPAFAIGIFRGLGAVFGLVATIVYPLLERRMGVVPSSRSLIIFQAAMIVLALVFFRASPGSSMAFLGFILLSRIGLYGFSIGETQIRQQGIAANARGRVNGFASALTSVATLGLYGAGAWFSSPSEFAVLVYASGASVCIAAAIFSVWSWSKRTAKGTTLTVMETSLE